MMNLCCQEPGAIGRVLGSGLRRRAKLRIVQKDYMKKGKRERVTQHKGSPRTRWRTWPGRASRGAWLAPCATICVALTVWLWGHGTSPLWGERRRSSCGRWSALFVLVGHSFTHRAVESETVLLDRGCTLFYSGVAQGVRQQNGGGDTHKSQIECRIVVFVLAHKRRKGGKTLTVVCEYAPIRSSQYSEPEWSLNGTAAHVDAYVSNDGNNWRGWIEKKGLPDLKLRSRSFLDFRASQVFSIQTPSSNIRMFKSVLGTTAP